MIRWISGIIIAVLVIAILVVFPLQGVQVVVVVCAVLTEWELLNLAYPQSSIFYRFMGALFCGLIVLCLIFILDSPQEILLLFTMLLLITFFIHFRGVPDLTERLHQMAFFYFGILYLGLLMTHWAWVRELDHWQFWTFTMLGSTFMADTGAYLVGKKWGRRHLAPQLSPKKTIEGYGSGIVFAVFAGLIVRQIFWPEFSLVALLLLTISVGALVPLGDLSESLIKRGFHAKDSGHLIPGHGGLLDRVDALLFAGPVVYYFARYVYPLL